MMTYAEFCNQVVPLVTEMEAECRKMTEQEFKDFRAEAIDKIRKGGSCHSASSRQCWT